MKLRKFLAIDGLFTALVLFMFCVAAMSAFGAGPAAKTDKVVYLINGALGDNAFYGFGRGRYQEHREKLQSANAHDRMQFRCGQIPASSRCGSAVCGCDLCDLLWL